MGAKRSMRPAFAVVGALAFVLAVAYTGFAMGWSGGVEGTGVAVSTTSPTPSAAPVVRPIQVVGQRPAPRPRGEPGPNGSVQATTARTVALTFDDGPSPEWTPKILRILDAYHVKATFCLIGENVVAYPELVRDIVAAGHTLCNHSWNHNLNLGKLSRPAILDDLRRTNQAIGAAVARAPVPYFRQPGGMWTDRVVQAARELGMASLHWTVDPQDWKLPAVAKLASILTNGCREGSIVLLHDGGGDRSRTYEALRRTLPLLIREHAFAALPAAGL